MERNLEIKIVKKDNGSFNIEIYEPETGDFQRLSFDYATGEKFNEKIGNEIYSWVSLLMDTEEE